MTRVNFCTFNCRPGSITDQVRFMQALFTELGCEFTVTDCLAVDALNFVIECFIPERRGSHQVIRIAEFCRRYRKRVGIIMSEHIELQPEGLTFNGTPLHDMTYIADKENRFFSLIGVAQYAMALFTLGCLPELNTFDEILPRHRIYRLPFPSLQPLQDVVAVVELDTKSRTEREPDYDLVFTGAITPYRRHVLTELAKRYSVHHSAVELPEAERLTLCRRGRLYLNIPQMPTWSWISPMRVMFGLYAGRATVHHGGDLRRTNFSDEVDTLLDIDAALKDWRGAHARQAKDYDAMAAHYRRRLPLAALELWARLEGVPFDMPASGRPTPALEYDAA